jgi:hypothetical protein
MAAVGPDGQTWCCSHAPDSMISPEQRTAWAKRGGLISTKKAVEKKLVALGDALPVEAKQDVPAVFKTAESTRQYLEKISQKIERGELAPSQGQTIGQLAKIALELAQCQLEKDLLDAELEQAREHGGRR